jgi:tetratricopeptide (TPR) repeat protein
MRSFLLLLWLSFSTLFLNAQDRHRIDSLRNVLITQQEDTFKVFSLADLAFEFIYIKPDSAAIFGEQALQLAKRLNYKRGVIQANTMITGINFVKGNYYRGIQVITENLRMGEEMKDQYVINFSLQYLTNLYKDMGDYNTALQFSLRAKRIDDSVGLIRWETYRDIGNIYERLDRLDSALKYTQRSYELELSDNGGNHPYPPFILGNIHRKSHNYELAMAYYHISLSRALKNYIYKDVIDNFNGMSKLFEETKKPDSVIFYSKEALRYHGIVSYTKGAQEAAAALAKTFRLAGNVDSSLKYFELSTTLKDSLYNQEKVMQVQNLAYGEQQHLKEIDEANAKQAEERKHNLQYALIGIGLISFLILFFLLSHSIIVKTGLIKFLGIVGLLLVFEYFNLFIHPYLGRITDHSPIWMLLILVCLAALLVPLHHRLEKWITHRLAEKNKRIRLNAAKKTIADLEENNTK